MKGFTLLFLCTLSLSAFARPEVLKCLGSEEKRLHLKKDLGPLYDLNQRLISEIVQIPNARINDINLQQICTGKGSESLKLLKHSLVKEKELFMIPASVTGMQKQVTEGMIEDYVEATKEILLSFLFQIQSIAPSPTCLKEEIKELDTFLNEIKHLQGDVDIKVLFKGREETLFAKLTDYRDAFDRCRARLKKKPKSESTEAPKKS